MEPIFWMLLLCTLVFLFFFKETFFLVFIRFSPSTSQWIKSCFFLCRIWFNQTQGRPWPICCPRQDFTWCLLHRNRFHHWSLCSYSHSRAARFWINWGSLFFFKGNLNRQLNEITWFTKDSEKSLLLQSLI